MKPLRLETGAVKVPVLDEFGDELCVIKFNPTDVNILNRVEDAKKEINSIAELFEGKEDITEGEILEQANQSVINAINKVVNAHIGEALFSINSPFSPLESGRMYCQEVLDGINDMIIELFGNRFDKFGESKAKMEAELAEYNKEV